MGNPCAAERLGMSLAIQSKPGRLARMLTCYAEFALATPSYTNLYHTLRRLVKANCRVFCRPVISPYRRILTRPFRSDKECRAWVRMTAACDYSPRSSRAARTAAITNAEKVHSFPLIAFSTSSTMSPGKRIVLLTVGGFSGILNFPIAAPSKALQLYCYHFIAEWRANMHCVCNAYLLYWV